MIRWLAVMTAVAFGCVAYPMYVIRPFRAQGSTELAVALVVRAWGYRFDWQQYHPDTTIVTR